MPLQFHFRVTFRFGLFLLMHSVFLLQKRPGDKNKLDIKETENHPKITNKDTEFMNV